MSRHYGFRSEEERARAVNFLPQGVGWILQPNLVLTLSGRGHVVSRWERAVRQAGLSAVPTDINGGQAERPTVWILSCLADASGGAIVGVYATEELGRKALALVLNDEELAAGPNDYEITEHEVEEYIPST